MTVEVVGVVGKRGYGKSTWLRMFMRGKRRRFVYDPMAQTTGIYINEEELWNLYDQGLFANTDSDETHDFCYVITDAGLLDILGNIAFVSGNCWLVIEEAATVFNRGENLPSWVNNGVFLGRHRDLNIAIVAQRAASIPIGIRSQFSRFVAFAQHEPEDIKYIGALVGRDYAERLPSLPFYTCLDYWPELSDTPEFYQTADVA